MDVREAHQQVVDEITQLEAQKKGLQAKLDQLEAEKRGLELWLARHNGKANGQTPEPGWVHLSRASAVERLLREADRPLGPSEISRLLEGKGRKGDTPHYVGAALSYLRRTKRALKQGQGQWTIMPMLIEARLGEPEGG